MTDKKSVFQDTLNLLKKKDDDIEESIEEEKYSDDFEDSAEASGKKDSPKKTAPKSSPFKKEKEASFKEADSPKKKLAFPEGGLKISKGPDETAKPADLKESLTLPLEKKGSLKDNLLDKKAAGLDAATLERIDLEEAFTELKTLLKKKRTLFLQFCEDKENAKIKLGNKDDLVTLSLLNPFQKIEREKQLEELQKSKRKGQISTEDFLEVLKRFEFKKTNKDIIIKFLKALNCYFQPSDLIYYLKLLRIMLKAKSTLNKTTNKFDYFKPLKTFPSEASSLDFIRESMRTYKKKVTKKADEEKKKLEDDYNVNLDDISKDPSKFLQLLREKVAASNKSLNDIFKSFDQNGDGMIQFEEFKECMQATGINFKEITLKQMFIRFDKNESGSVSYMEFLETIYSDKMEDNVFAGLQRAERNLKQLQLLMQGKFNTYNDMRSAMVLKSAERMTETEFKIFVQTHTEVFSRLQLADMFVFLDPEKRGFIEGKQMQRIYGDEEMVLGKIKEKKPEPERKSSFKTMKQEEEEAKQKAEEKAKNEKKEERRKIIQELDFGEGSEANKLPEKKVLEIFGVRDPNKPAPKEKDVKSIRPDSVATQHYRPENLKRSDLLEKFMVEFSNSSLNILRNEGKNLRDLFNIFSKEVNGFLNIDEFYQACRFIMAGNVEHEFTNSFFNFFVTGHPRKMTFKVFSHIIFTGKKGNSIYIKLKHKFKQHVEASRRIFNEEFQRMDSDKGSGEIPLNDFIELFEVNEVRLDENDIKLLENEEVLITKNDRKLIRYNRFMKIIFPDSNPIERIIQMQATAKIKRFFYKMRAKKAEQRAKEEEMKKHESVRRLKSPKGGRSGRSTSKTAKKVTIAAEPAKEDTVAKHKELYEFEKSGTPKGPVSAAPATNVTQKRSSSATKRGKKGPEKELSMEEKLKKTLGEPPKDDRTKEKVTAIYNKCKSVINEIIDNVLGYGNSLKLSKEIQKKYETRPVIKDVFVTLQDLEIDIIDLIPRSLSISTSTGRVGYMDKEGNLFEYDIANKQNLKSINLSSKVPLKKSRIIDYAFDNKAGRIYTLTDSWMLEVWEIHQELSVPVSRLKILTDNFDPNAISNTYLKRYGDTFPQFMTLSSSSHQLLIINCSCINNSIVFVDPVSVSVFSQVFLKQVDYKVPESLTKTLYHIKPHIDDMIKHTQTFEKLFEKYLVQEGSQEVLKKAAFVQALKDEFKLDVHVNDEELGELFEFLDQNSDGSIVISELYYLHEITKMVASKGQEDKVSIPLALQGLDENTIRTLQKLNNFVKRTRLNLVEAFKIFDNNNSGSISAAEFFDVLDQLVDDVSREDKENLLKVADKDKNGSINFEEFSSLFVDVEQYEAVTEMRKGLNLRTNLFILFEKAYNAGIDVEAEFLKYDTMAEGTLQITDFKTLVRSLPFGLLDSEIAELLEHEVTYTDSGRIDYQQVIQTPEFKKCKFIAKMRDNQNKEEIHSLMHKVETDQHFFEPQKIIVESVTYIDDFDLMVYTTLVPRTSTIFISSTKRNTGSKEAAVDASHIFSNKLLAKLEGHKTNAPPTIFYCSESGCLISGDKIDKKVEFNPRASGNKATEPAQKEQFINFYTNIESNKQFSTDILIWNLQKDLFDLCNANPPWKVKPTHVIKNAHYDSIIDITYLPISQLIITSSVDKTIKVWDPVARPYSLKHPKNVSFIRQKPGVYDVAKDQETITNQKFAEVKRIYTGDQICHRLTTSTFRIPVSNMMNNENFTGKQINLEMLLVLCLAKPQLTGKTMKSTGTIKGYSIDRLELEIPANRVDDVIPRKYYKELEDLCLERRKKALVHLQNFLPNLLETMKVKVFIQDNDLKKIVSLFKKVSLQKFSSDAEKNNTAQDIKDLFHIFTNLPLRVSFDKFINEAGLQKTLSIPEIFYYLRRFRQIHPLNITKSEFFRIVEDVNTRVKKTILSEKKTLNPLIERIADLIKVGKIDLKADLFQNQKKGNITRDKLIAYLEGGDFGLEINQKDMDELLNNLDPYIVNRISLEILEEMFGNEILEYKLGLHSRPNQIIKNLTGYMDGKQKMLLIFSMNECNLNKDNYLTKDEFMQGFINSGVPFNKLEVLELFELLAEKYSKTDNKKYLNLNYFSKKLFTPSENFELLKIYYILGKIKNGFIFKRTHPQHIFADYNPETKTFNKVSNDNISTLDFIKRVETINIPNLQKAELEKAAYFLSLKNELSHNSFVPLNLLLYYFRSLEVKYQFTTTTDLSKLYDAIKYILARETDITTIYNRAHKKKLDPPLLRHILNEVKVDIEMIDEVLARFLDDNESHLEHFLTKLRNFMTSMAPVSPSKKSTFKASFSEEKKEEASSKSPEKKADDKKEKFDLSDLLRTKTKDEAGRAINTKSVINKEFIQAVVNAIRAEGVETIQKIKRTFESFDTKKTGKLKLPTFVNIIQFNCASITEEMSMKFQSQYERAFKEVNVDYQWFIDEFLTDKEAAASPEKKKTEININSIMIKVATAIKASKVNVHYAFRFFDERLTGTVSVEDFKKLFAWIKADLIPEEFDYLIEFCSDSSRRIDYSKFLDQIEISNHNLSVVYDKYTWKVGSEAIKEELLEKASTNSDTIKAFVTQKLKEVQSPVQLPLLPAIVLHKALAALKYDFSLKEVDDLVKYAIVGSQISLPEAQKKLKELERIDVTTEVVNFDQFLKSLQDFINARRDFTDNRRKGTDNKSLTEEEHKLKLEDKQLISKIKGILKDRDVTLWDSIISADMTITEQSKISLREFELILNSLNLGLTLKEKLMLYRIADPFNIKKVDLKALIEILEEKGLSDKVMKVILEKLGIALFFNDLSFKAAFDYFDVDHDENISKNEFIYGFSQLDLGLSIFEINQLATMIDINKDGNISRNEFTQSFEMLFNKYGVDPSKDLSFSLYAKIKNLLSVKGKDLLACFKQIDMHHKGYLNYDGFVKALNNFGLENLQPYQITALLKLNKVPPSEEPKSASAKLPIQRKLTSVMSPKNPDFKVYYEGLHQNLISEVDKNLKMVIEVTHDLLRKIYKMISAKNVSLFEAFVHFDSNLKNAISKLEFKIGLQNFNIYLKENEMNLVWNSFSKTRNYKVSFTSFMKSFIEAGALQIVKFDEGRDLLMKKFIGVTAKLGNFEEAFRKLDQNNNGVVPLQEFQEQCLRLHLGILPNEVETVFHEISQIDKDKIRSQDPNAAKGFTYRQFVRLALKYKNLSLLNNIFAKIYNSAKERKIIWKQQFSAYKTESKNKTQGDILLRDLKNLLKTLKLGISNDEIDTVINSFDSPVVNFQTFERRTLEGAKKTEESAREKDLLIYSLVNEINQALHKEKIPLERVFFDFDTNQNGTVDLAELTNMVFFLKITASKNQIKTFFEAIDYDKKGYITLIELKSFLEESKIQQSGQDDRQSSLDKEKSKYEEIYMKIKEGLVNHNTTLQRVIHNSGHKLSEVMTKTALEKLLITIDVVLKKDELELIYTVVLDSAGNKNCNFEDLQNFAIKNQIEVINLDEKITHIHPAIAVYIEKMNTIFRKLEIGPSLGYRYLASASRGVVVKKTFERGIQTFNMNLTQDDIILLYEYFDEKNYGEISLETFLEKFELLITMGILKLSGGNELEEETGETDLSVHKISSRHQLIGIMQRIYMYFVEKKYNKRQMVALFDRNGNGILTKDDFIEGLKALGLDIPLEKARVLANYLDSNDRGVVEVDDFIARVQQSMPQNLRGDLKSSQALSVLRNVVDRLREQVPSFLQDLVRHEKNLKSDDAFLYRPKTGVYILDFYKLLKDYGINVNEDEKTMVKEVYLLPSSSNFLDIEALYRTTENLSNTLLSSGAVMDAAQNDKELNEVFEQKVYRRIGDQLRKMNISILQAFDFIDKDKNGYISESEMRTLFKSLNLEFTEREIAFLISKFEGSQHGIVSKKEFVEKFWHSYAKFGQKQENERIKDLKTHQRKIITNTLNFCKNKKKWSCEEAWVNLDYNRNGLITLDDLRNSLVGSGLFITKEDIAVLFNFIDFQTQDGKVDFMEFCDFWNETTNLFDQGIPVDNEISQLSNDILEHLAKILDQREISLWDFYSEIDPSNKGYLTEREFSHLLRKAGLEIDDIKVEKLMRLIDMNADKRIAFSELETKLLQAGLTMKRAQEIERISWIDKGMKNLLLGLNANLKLEGYDEFFKKFDSDFDGYLTPEEFYNALKTFGKIISTEQAERVANIFQTNLSDNRISIQRIITILNKMLNNSETKAQQYEIASIGEEIFYYIVLNYEGINRLFLSLNELRKTYKDVHNSLNKTRKKVRGFSLMGVQNTTNHLAKKLDATEDLIQKGMNLMLRVANNFIINDKMVKLIDPTQNVPCVDRERVRERDMEFDKVELFQIGDNAAFNVDYDSISYLSPYIKYFDGYYFRTNSPVRIDFYDKFTLSVVCTDGNQFYKHLDFELKLHNLIMNKGDYAFKYLAKYEKKVGLDSSEKDVYLINESIDLTKWISLKDLIKENGGLLRIPFLTRTKAVIYIIKYWAQQILKIMLEVQKLGCVLLLMRPENIYISKDGQKVKFKSFRGCGKLNEFGKVSLAPDFYINLFDPDVKVNPENNTTHKVENDVNEKIFSDPYLAPEMIFNKIQDLDQNVDSWVFGCLLYQILFGQPPKSFYDEILKVYPQIKKDLRSFAHPSDYFFHDIYPDSLINDILHGDHEVFNAEEAPRRMIDCIGHKSYEAFFANIIPQKNLLNEEFNKNSKEHLNRIGCYLDLIASCLEFSPSKRPTIQALYHCPVFQLDKYEDMISRQFSEIMIFYKSPTLTIRDKVLVPLRKICAQIIETPKKIVLLENDILRIMDIVNWSIIEKKPKPVEELKKTTTTRFGESASKFNVSSTSKDSEAEKLVEAEKGRANNQLLVKFIFSNYILDILVFLALRHHTKSRKYLKKRKSKIERTYDDTVRLVKGLLEIFKSIIFDMSSYQTSCSPYVQNFLENFVKFLLGEEFKLTSDIADLLSGNQELNIIRNTYDEYSSLKVDVGDSLFRSPADPVRDDADREWKKRFASRPYIFSESHWTPDLYLIVGPIYKESVSEAGSGSVEYPVIQDYIRFETENNRNFDFDMENRMSFMNHKTTTYFRRTVDYYNDIMHITENLQILYQADARAKSNIRVSLQYLKALLQSNNTDKIKLLLDSKIMVSAMKYLAIEDVHIKTELLEILYEISKGFEREPLSLITQEKNEALRTVEENLKTVGVISQLKESRVKDKTTKDKLITYSYDYYSFNKKINSKYIQQLGLIYESPVVMTYLTAVVKTQAELLHNKKLVIKIFENISNGPISVIKALNYSSIDTISSICKIFITSRKGIEIKQNAVLAPLLVDAFKKILSDCRPEFINYLNHIPGTRVFLKEQGLEVPPKLNLTLLYEKYTNLADFFVRNRDKLVQEVQGGIVASQIGTMNHNTAILLKFNSLISENNTTILSWLTHYYKRKEGGVVFVDVKQYFDKALDLYINIFDYLLEYGQLNNVCGDIVNQIGYLFESIGVTEFYYLFVTTKDMERATRTLHWLLDKVFYFFNFYAGLDLNERENELKEREDELRATQSFGREKKMMILSNILNKQSLKRYGENRLNPTYKAFLRIFYFLTSLNNPEYNNLLKKVEFGKYFVEILRAQYHIISSVIQTGTENIHLIVNYAEESQIRLKTLERLLLLNDDSVKDEFIKTGIVHDLCNKYLKSFEQLDVSTYKLTFKFLPFRNFLPIRNEALAIVSMIAQHRQKCPSVYSDLILALTRYSNLRNEYENLRKYKKGLITTSSLYFFTIILQMNDPQITHILKQENVISYLKDLLAKSSELNHYYADLAKLLEYAS